MQFPGYKYSSCTVKFSSNSISTQIDQLRQFGPNICDLPWWIPRALLDSLRTGLVVSRWTFCLHDVSTHGRHISRVEQMAVHMISVWVCSVKWSSGSLPTYFAHRFYTPVAPTSLRCTYRRPQSPDIHICWTGIRKYIRVSAFRNLLENETKEVLRCLM